jgi:hypothetical protein
MLGPADFSIRRCAGHWLLARIANSRRRLSSGNPEHGESILARARFSIFSRLSLYCRFRRVGMKTKSSPFSALSFLPNYSHPFKRHFRASAEKIPPVHPAGSRLERFYRMSIRHGADPQPLQHPDEPRQNPGAL